MILFLLRSIPAELGFRFRLDKMLSHKQILDRSQDHEGLRTYGQADRVTASMLECVRNIPSSRARIEMYSRTGLGDRARRLRPGRQTCGHLTPPLSQ